MIKYDYHMHTNYSLDSNAPMEQMILSAIEKGFYEIALTDHIDCMYGVTIDYDEYFRALQNLQKRYSQQINIVLGVELGLAVNSPVDFSTFLQKYPFDFIIASTHDVMGLDLWNQSFFRGKNKNTAYRLYFEEIIKNVQMHPNLSVCGHLDFIIRYAPYKDRSLQYKDYSDLVDQLLKLLIDNGKGIEINTSGFRYQLNTTHPQREIIVRYLELGGEIITVGSDAHSPEHIGSHFDYVEQILKELGVKRICRFKELKPIFVDL